MKTSWLDFLSNTTEKFFLFDGHFLTSPLRFLVLVTEKMKNAMDHQKGDHLHLVQTKSFLLAQGCLNGNDQIPQKMGMKNREFPFPHREGKDIGRFVSMEVSPIHRLNLSIIDQ